MNTEDALKRAMDEGLDLVEVNPTSRPPVCKLMDYGKFKYEQKKKTNEAKKKQKVIEVKEVKLRPKTDDHDFDFKVDHIRRFIGDGNKAKVTIMFRGREITHPEIGKQVLDRVVDAVKDVAMIESYPRMEGRNMYMVIAPGKAPQRPTTPGAPTTQTSSGSSGSASPPRSMGPQGPQGPRPMGGQGPQGPRPAPAPQAPAPAPAAAAAAPPGKAQ